MAREVNRGVLPHAWIALIGLLIVLEQVVFAPAQSWAQTFPQWDWVQSMAQWAEATARRREVFLTLFLTCGLIGLWWRGVQTLRLAGAPLFVGWALVPAAALLGGAAVLWPDARLSVAHHLVALAYSLCCLAMMWIVSGGRLPWAVIGTLWGIVGICRHVSDVIGEPLWVMFADVAAILGSILAAAIALSEGFTNRRRRRLRLVTLLLAIAAGALWYLSLRRGGAAETALREILGWHAQWPALVHGLAFLAIMIALSEILHRRRLRWALWPLAVWFAAGSQLSALTQLQGLWALLAWTIVIGWAEETGARDASLPAYLS